MVSAGDIFTRLHGYTHNKAKARPIHQCELLILIKANIDHIFRRGRREKKDPKEAKKKVYVMKLVVH